MVEMLMQELKAAKSGMTSAKERALAIAAKLEEIDPLIRSASNDYSFERISRVEKTILRLGVYEMLYDEALPPKVAIAEAIRLCRKFATRESAEYVNAIMDGVYKTREVAREPLPL